MGNLTSEFQAMVDPEFPRHLHTVTMRRVLIRHHRPLFLLVGAMLVLNATVSVWSAWTKAVELGTVDMIRFVVSDVRMSYLSLAEGLQIIHDVTPVRSVAIALMNTVLAIYLILLFRSEQSHGAKVDHSDA